MGINMATVLRNNNNNNITRFNSQNSTNIIRLVVISDTHGNHRLLETKLPSSSSGRHDDDNIILIHCGDFCNKGSINDAKDFAKWITNLRGYKAKIIIDGNHDRKLYSNSNNNNEDSNNNNIPDNLTAFAPVTSGSPARSR